jgi:predicted RNA binding protein YcfA (HicA-like mRNA interferase family)
MALPSSNEVVKALAKDGFQPRGKSRRGSHQVFRKESPDGARNVVVPLGKKEIPRGTLRSMIRQAGPTATNLAALAS